MVLLKFHPHQLAFLVLDNDLHSIGSEISHLYCLSVNPERQSDDGNGKPWLVMEYWHEEHGNSQALSDRSPALQSDA